MKFLKKFLSTSAIHPLTSVDTDANGMIRRLSTCTSVPSSLLSLFAQGLFYGKLRVHANIVFAVRLRDEDKKTTGAKEIQILINYVARVVAGRRRGEDIRIGQLLGEANLPSLNVVVVQASGMLAWHMSHPDHPLHGIFRESRIESSTRSATSGLVKVTGTGAQESITVCNA